MARHNVRELANIIERTVVLDFEELIDASHLYLEPIVVQKPKAPSGCSLYEMEKRLILDTLEAHHHNRTKAAALLGISIGLSAISCKSMRLQSKECLH